MAWRTTWILALVLLSAYPSLGDPSEDRELSTAEYAAQLDRLILKTGQTNLTDAEITDILHTLPPTWRVNVENQEFDISTEWLHDDLENYDRRADEGLLKTDYRKLVALRADLDGYLKAPPNTSADRTRLMSILSRREFSSVHGPNWIDRLKQRLILFLYNLLSRVFHSSSIPAIGNYFVYGLAVLAVLGLAYWIYRSIRREAEMERIVPEVMAISAKEWTVWMAEAREAADQGNWRDAIHLAYWAGISFLEGEGAWRPDRARTPREYLRLMPRSSENHTTLTALTHSFEVVWYGNREADADAFSQTLQELEKLGCRQS